MIRIKNSKRLLRIFIYCNLLFAVSYLLTGCAGIPVKGALVTYHIHGTTYLPLISLCETQGIRWEYDTFSHTAVLSRDAHKISLMVGDTLVLVDGVPKHLKYPVDIYQGTVVVPYKFRDEILGNLFKQPSTYKAPVCLIKIRKVIIDAGHGGTDPGAIGRTGLREKDVTLDVAKRLCKLLESEGIEVVMTRSSDRFVSLESRVDITNNSKADLFLSIHANANRVKSLSGFEIYYVSGNIDDSKRALSAAREATLALDRSCFAGSSLNVKAILWDMIYTYNRAESIELSRSICKTINRDLDTKILGIKGARFYVLKEARMPAILVEIGFLSNYGEERMLKNNYYRQRITEGIVAGVKNYAQDVALMEAAKQ